MNNENQNLNSVVPPTTGPQAVPSSVPPVAEQPTTPVPPIEPAAPNIGPMVQPVPPAAPGPAPTPVNLQPEGTVPPEAPAAPTPTVAEPLMGTPLNDQTVINPQPAVTPMTPPMGPAGTPGMGPIPPMPNGGMMGGIPTPPTVPTQEEKPKKKFNPLLIVLIVVLVAGVGFGIYYFISQSKPKKPSNTVTITPLLSTLELGTDFDLEQPLLYATVTSPIDINACEVSTDLDPYTVGTYQYTVICGQYKLENQTVTVSDTTAPKVVTKDIAVLPGAEVNANDFVVYVDDASTYSFLLENEIDTSEEGQFEVTFTVEDDYSNQTEVKANLTVSEDAPEYYLSCRQGHLSSEKYQSAIVSESYRFGINSLGELYNAYKTRVYRFETEEGFDTALEDVTDEEFDGYKGDVRVDKNDSSITVYYPTDKEGLAKDYNVTEFPELDVDIEEFYTANEGMCEAE